MGKIKRFRRLKGINDGLVTMWYNDMVLNRSLKIDDELKASTYLYDLNKLKQTTEDD